MLRHDGHVAVDPADPSPAEGPSGAYRIDDLAREAGTTVRNVRAYQERGLLAPPRREGRVAIYDDGHLARVRLILRLLERGATLALIGDLVDAWHEGHDIADLLGVEAALLAPAPTAADEGADGTVALADLAALFGQDPDPDDVGRAVALGVLAPDGDGYRVEEPRLLQIAVDLAGMGVPVADMLDHVEVLRGRVEAVAEDFVELAVRHVFAGLVDDLTGDDPTLDPERLARAVELVQRLRPLAKAAVDAELSRALDGAIATRITDLLHRG